MKSTIRIALLASLCAIFCAKGECRAATSEPIGLRTVVIDAGHGGKDPGCVSPDKKTYEKTLTLDIARNLADKIRSNYPEVKVILTRDSDEYITLNARADKANKANADLFISIHINASAKTAPNGYSVHILGQSSSSKDLLAYNMDVCRRENSVILLEEDYSTKYQGFDPADPESFIFMALMQNSYLEQSLHFAQVIGTQLKGGSIKEDRGLWQNGFYVLWKTAMPSVLVELGFISNSADLTALRKKESREDISTRLFKAFCEYKKSYDESVSANSSESVQVEAAKIVRPDEKEQSTKLYGTQIFALSRLIPEFSKEFMGYKPRVIKSGNVYKYIIGLSSNIDSAKLENAKIKMQYPNGYFVEIEDENIVLLR